MRSLPSDPSQQSQLESSFSIISRHQTHLKIESGLQSNPSYKEIINDFDFFDDTCPEVQLTKKWANRKIRFHSKHIYTDIREAYRIIKTRERYDPDERIFHKIIDWIHFTNLLTIVKKIIKENSWILDIASLLIECIFAFLYLYEIQFDKDHPCKANNCPGTEIYPSWFVVHRGTAIFFQLLILSIIKLTMNFIYAIVQENPIMFLFSAEVLLDLTTTVPFILCTFVQIGEFIYVPYFLRFFLVTMSLKSVLRSKRKWSPFKISEFMEKFVILSASILTLLFFGVSAFSYSESNFDSERRGQDRTNLSLLDSFYFILITMTTVGYGDITPGNPASQVIVMMVIFAGLIVLPGLITDVQETIKMQALGAGSFIPGRNPYVIICGVFDNAARILDIAKTILAKDVKDNISFVLLSRTKMPATVKYALKSSRLKNRFFIINGSGYNTKDLERVQLKSASAAIILADLEIAPEMKRSEDEQNTLRAWAFSDFSPEVPLFVETLLPDTSSLHEEFTSATVCIDEFRQIFLGYNCLYRGVATLMINLLRLARRTITTNHPWQEQYGDGMRSEIFKAPLNEIFVGKRFAEVSMYLYKEFQIILFALQIYIPEKRVKHITLNPGLDYSLRAGDICYFIANSYEDVSAVSQLTMAKYLRTAQKINTIDTVREIFSPTSPETCQNITKHSTVTSPVDQRWENYRTGYPALSNKTKVPRCLLLEKSVVDVASMTIESAAHLKAFILVCTGDFHIFRLVCTLRSAHLTKSELKPLVIMCDRLPTSTEFQKFACFPELFFFVGFANKAENLIRAGIFTADKIILTNMLKYSKSKEFESERLTDAKTIMVSNLIEKLCSREGIKKHIVTDLTDKSNAKFLSIVANRKGKTTDTIGLQDVYFNPLFASGRVVTSLMQESIISAAYFQPSIVSIFSILCGVRYEVDYELDNLLGFEPSNLCYIAVPENLLQYTFGHLYELLAQTVGIIPIGILRETDVICLKNKLPFVYTNPPWSLQLRKTDLIYVIANPNKLS
ncbi:hypothetical protein BC833DRAFT_624078 [Globomyces pollinis-pini]|nr:hypothetical protein BC833DRAFT_624078 [Globomyces pollinis-pini]